MNPRVTMTAMINLPIGPTEWASKATLVAQVTSLEAVQTPDIDISTLGPKMGHAQGDVAGECGRYPIEIMSNGKFKEPVAQGFELLTQMDAGRFSIESIALFYNPPLR